jgi:hypothetical protein
MMATSSHSGIGIPFLALAIMSCGQKEEPPTGAERSKAKAAVEEAVTRDFKLYEGAIKSLDTIEQQAEERREKETELLPTH